MFRGDDFIFVATNLESIDSFSGRRLFIKRRSILKETNTTVRNLDGGSTTADKRSSGGEFIGQFTRGVVGVVSAKRNALHNTEQVSRGSFGLCKIGQLKATVLNLLTT